jgi:hypothetical protein
MLITAEQYQNTETNKAIIESKAKNPYVGTPFEALQALSSRSKGSKFEHLVQELFEGMGQKVRKPKNSEHDRIINGVKTEIKSSFGWIGDDGEITQFRWQQIRPSQDYEVMLFVAAYPDRLELYWADKEVVAAHVEVQNSRGHWIYNQHGGKKVNSGTFFLDGFPEDFPWMKKVQF